MKPRVVMALVLAAAVARGESVAPPSYSGRPYIRTFRSADIHSRGPIRCFAETAAGTYFIGSDLLSLYDGSIWRQVEAPGVRGIQGLALAADGRGRSSDRVWVAAQTAAGYVEQDEVGAWRFVSLTAAARAAGAGSTPSFRGVFATAAGAVFVTADAALRWDGHRFEYWHLASRAAVISCGARDGGAWIWAEGRGLWKIGESGPPALVRALGPFPGSPVVWILPPNAPPAGTMETRGFLVGTGTGVYRLAAAGFERLPQLSDAIANQIPIGAAALAGNSLAVNTLNDGVVFADRGGAVTAVVNRRNGLRDDAVHALWPGRVREEIWIGLDDGCQRISSLGRVSMFDAREGLERGATQRVVALRGKTYVVTNKAVYRIQPVPGGPVRLQSVFESNPGLAGAAASNGVLWVGGYRGLWKVEADSAAVFRAGEGGPVEALTRLRGGNTIAYVQDGELRMVPVKAGAPPSPAIKLDAPVVSLVADLRFGVWLVTEDDRLEHFAATSAGRLEKAEQYSAGRGLPALAGRPSLAACGGRVFVFTDRQIFVWNQGRLETPPELASWSAVAGDAGATNTGYWIARRQEPGAVFSYSLLRVEVPVDDRQPLQLTSLRCAGLDAIGPIRSVSVTQDAAGEWIWIGGEDGIVRAAASRLDPAGQSFPRVAIRQVMAAGDTEHLLPLTSATEVKITPDVHDLRFVFSPAEPVDPGAEYYQTRLQGVEADWGAPQSDSQRQFTGLSPGHYVFAVRRMDRFGHAGPAAAYRFSLAPPWYNRWPAEIAAVLAALAVFGAILRWRVGQLRRQAARLDRLVADRTRALELSNVARSEFLENISHEIRNPLNGLTGLLGLIDEKALPQKDRRLAVSLRAVAADLIRIFDQVLNFSKAEYGYVHLERRPFLLQPVIQAAIDLAAPLAAQRGATLALDWGETIADGFEGDPDKIRAMVGNLIGNAIKYAPGPIRVVVSSEPADPGVSDVIIEIIDQGAGIPLEEQELIFEKFVRGSDAKRGRTPGTGLGLALCRAYARLMSGSIHVDSRPGAGSNFVVQLPLRRNAEAMLPSPLPPPGGNAGSGPSRSVLIVEDENYNRLILQTMMEQEGWQTRTAESVAAAFAELEERSFDAVLLDLELPDGKGFEVARFIRARPDLRPKVIATTGHDSAEMLARCREAAMDGFLVKPYSAAEVHRILAAVESSDPGAFALRTSVLPAAPTETLDLSALRLLEAAGRAPAGGSGRFAEAMDEELSRLERLLQANDAAGAAGVAHRVRALAGLLGSDALTAGAARIQALAATQPAASREQAFELQNIWRRLRPQLDRRSE